MNRITASLLLVLPCLIVPRAAQPCSLVPPSQLGVAGGIVGVRPILVSTREITRLEDSEGRTVAIQPWTPSVELVNATAPGGLPVFFFEPTEDLAVGDYIFDGLISLTVEAGAPNAIPDPGTEATMALFLGSDDETQFGCGGISSCGLVQSLQIELPNASGDSSTTRAFLVTLTPDKGTPSSRLVQQMEFGPANGATILFYVGSESDSITVKKTCVQVRGVSPDGRVGEAVDLGCIDPTDDDDTRVSGDRPGGCNTTGRGRSVPIFAMLAAGLGLGTLRRRRS